MNIRNIISVIVILLGFILVGCTDDSYRGTIDVDMSVIRDIPHEVRMTIGAPEDDVILEESALGTRGSGVIGDLSGFSGKEFYVYAFNQDGYTSLQTVSAQDSIRCLIDGSRDDPESLMGRKALWNPKTEYVEWESGDDQIYYPMGEGAGHIYNFFAYYLDDMEVDNDDFHRMDHAVQIDIEIDGSQDIMSSRAEPTEKQLSQIKDIKDSLYIQHCAYGYYTASRGLHPNFVFTHHLVKLDFKLVPGGTPGMTKDVTVERIEIVSKHKGTFTVADTKKQSGLGISFEDDKTRLQLKEADGSEYRPRLISTYNQVGTVTDGIVDDLGSLLVAPDNDYYIYVVLGETREDGVVLESKENEVHVYQGAKDAMIPFTAGNEYLITMTIYGQMDIKVSTQIGKWDTGGDYEYDYDDVMRPGQDNTN